MRKAVAFLKRAEAEMCIRDSCIQRLPLRRHGRGAEEASAAEKHCAAGQRQHVHLRCVWKVLEDVYKRQVVAQRVHLAASGAEMFQFLLSRKLNLFLICLLYTSSASFDDMILPHFCSVCIRVFRQVGGWYTFLSNHHKSDL